MFSNENKKIFISKRDETKNKLEINKEKVKPLETFFVSEDNGSSA